MTTQTLISIPVIEKPLEGSTVSDPVTIAGMGKLGATVEVYVGSVLQLSITVDSAGKWQGQANLPKGVHKITARQRLGGSTSAPSPVRTFIVA
ncbi:hypothetical protein [Pseudomonas sp. LB3P14]